MTKKQKLREVEAALDKKDLLGYSLTPSGNVVLRMTRNDYNMILIALGSATGSASKDKDPKMVEVWVELINRINKGNSDFAPYQLDKNAKKP